MHKANLLRAWFEERFPDLARNPERFAMFVENGEMVWRNGCEPNGPSRFEYQYALEIVIFDWEGSLDAIMYPLAIWLTRNAPEMVNTEGRIPFDTAVMSATLSDISIKLKLCEAVQASAGPGGTTALEHFDEPDLEALFAPPVIPGEPPILVDIDNQSDPAPFDVIPPPWSIEGDGQP